MKKAVQNCIDYISNLMRYEQDSLKPLSQYMEIYESIQTITDQDKQVASAHFSSWQSSTICNDHKVVVIDDDIDNWGRVYFFVVVFNDQHIGRYMYLKDEFDPKKAVDHFKNLDVDNRGDKWTIEAWMTEKGSLL